MDLQLLLGTEIGTEALSGWGWAWVRTDPRAGG